MGFLTTNQLFIAFGLITTIDVVNAISSWQEKAWIAVILAIILIPFDLFSLYHVVVYDTDLNPDYSIHA